MYHNQSLLFSVECTSSNWMLTLVEDEATWEKVSFSTATIETDCRIETQHRIESECWPRKRGLWDTRPPKFPQRRMQAPLPENAPSSPPLPSYPAALTVSAKVSKYQRCLCRSTHTNKTYTHTHTHFLRLWWTPVYIPIKKYFTHLACLSAVNCVGPRKRLTNMNIHNFLSREVREVLWSF